MADRALNLDDFLSRFQLLRPQPSRHALNQRQAAVLVPIVRICAGPMVLGGLGLLKGKRATCFPFFEPTMVGATPTDNGVEQDGNIITSKGPGFMFEFGLTILRNLKDEEIALEVADALLYDALLGEVRSVAGLWM